MNKEMLVIFEGIQGVGKETQFNVYCKYLKDSGYDMRNVRSYRMALKYHTKDQLIAILDDIEKDLAEGKTVLCTSDMLFYFGELLVNHYSMLQFQTEFLDFLAKLEGIHTRYRSHHYIFYPNDITWCSKRTKEKELLYRIPDIQKVNVNVVLQSQIHNNMKNLMNNIAFKNMNMKLVEIHEDDTIMAVHGKLMGLR